MTGSSAASIREWTCCLLCLASGHSNARRLLSSRLAAKLEKVRERLEAEAPNLERPGADLIAYYLDPDRLPPDRRWSRKHAHTQRRLCERFAALVIGAVICQDIRAGHMQQIVNAAPTAGGGARVAGMISALVAAGIVGGYLANSRLKEVHLAGCGPRAARSEGDHRRGVGAVG